MIKGQLKMACDCPNCGKDMSGYAALKELPKDAFTNPKLVPIVVCMYCQAVLIYIEEGTKLHQLEGDELTALAIKHPYILDEIAKAKQFSKFIMKVNRERNN